MSEPVAFEYQHEETGVIGYIDQWQIDNGFFDNNPRLQLIGPLYRHPPKADLEAENAKLREACEVFAELNVKLEQQLERQEAYYMGDRAELAKLREAVEKIKVVERIVRETHGTPVKLGRAIDEAASLLQEKGE